MVIHGRAGRIRQRKAGGEQAKIQFRVKDTKQPYTRVTLVRGKKKKTCKSLQTSIPETI